VMTGSIVSATTEAYPGASFVAVRAHGAPAPADLR
jgi:hypothetical protein